MSNMSGVDVRGFVNKLFNCWWIRVGVLGEGGGDRVGPDETHVGPD